MHSKVIQRFGSPVDPEIMQKYLRMAYFRRFSMFREFVTDIAPAVLLSLVLSIAGVIAAVELANILSAWSKRVKRALPSADPLGSALLFSTERGSPVGG
jgi:hypothetical protein